jgi:hypothetical protein
MGAFQGSLSCFSATQLGGFAIKGAISAQCACTPTKGTHPCAGVPLLMFPLLAAALERAGIQPDAVGEVFMGNVCSANLGQVTTAVV